MDKWHSDGVVLAAKESGFEIRNRLERVLAQRGQPDESTECLVVESTQETPLPLKSKADVMAKYYVGLSFLLHKVTYSKRGKNPIVERYTIKRDAHEEHSSKIQFVQSDSKTERFQVVGKAETGGVFLGFAIRDIKGN